MWLLVSVIPLSIISIAAIRIPVESAQNNRNNYEQVPVVEEQLHVNPIYYTTDDANVDSFLVPSNAHEPEEIIHDVLATPATFLLPPTLNTPNEYYYKPTEPGEQTDWYPIPSTPQKEIEVIPIIQNERSETVPNSGNFRTGKTQESQVVPVPSTHLLPPREDASNDFIVLSPSVELELPAEEIDHNIFNTKTNAEQALNIPRAEIVKNYKLKLRTKPKVPLPYITPPENIPIRHNTPTILYPKKYRNEFRPMPIPISELEVASEYPSPSEILVRPQNPTTNPINENPQEKKHYLYEKSEHKRKHSKKQHEATRSAAATEATHEENPSEQLASETHYREPGPDSHLHHSKQPPLAPLKQPVIKSNGERTEFRMHGMKGPHSYQFGYDTGKGKNRQFRYEERDNDGHVRGHYGYVDKFGKLRVVNYDADPEHGFRAEAPVEKE